MALDGESPYDNKDLFNYLQRHMSIMKSSNRLPYSTVTKSAGYTSSGTDNDVFYATDGMHFEFDWAASATTSGSLKLHESDNYACFSTATKGSAYSAFCDGCGSYGLAKNPNETTKVPCAILVDVNGDRKPTPGNINCQNNTCASTDNRYWVPLPGERKLGDIFTILITEDRAIPYGVTAQKAMYGAQK